MRRREALTKLAVTFSVFSGCAEQAGTDLSSNEDSSEQKFGFGSPGFEKIEWLDGGVLRIHFGTHSMDGFGIRHMSLDDVSDDEFGCEAPKSVGTRDVPLIKIIRGSDTVYPSRGFNLWAYEGSFRSCEYRGTNLITEIVGSVDFSIPMEIAPPANFQGVESKLTTPPTTTEDGDTVIEI